MFSRKLTLSDVHRIKRPDIGYVYIGKISIGNLYLALLDGDIAYAPKYQRGFSPALEVDDVEYDKLVSINDERLVMQSDRAEAIACKYLMAVNGLDKKLFNPEIIWNARLDPNRPQPEYDPDARTLTISTKLTIPDSGHRHWGYYKLAEWKNDPSLIPDEVEVEDNGQTVSGDEIRAWLENFDPFDAEESSILVLVFTLPKQEEGPFFSEYNDDTKKASSAAAIELHPDKDPARRFVEKLMRTCPIFAKSEIETRANTIGSKSRKLTTNATLVSAIRPFGKQLFALEQEGGNAHNDVVEFFCAFYKEWAKHYEEYESLASAEKRVGLRRNSFALSNVLFFPMFRLAWELWNKYRKAGKDWRATTEWSDGLARLAGSTTYEVEIDGKKQEIEVEVMARDVYDDNGEIETAGNPAWQGLILVRKFDKTGRPTGWSLSSTRQTRDAAFHYIADVADVDLPSRKS